jgi:hypothetical protein
MVYTYYLLLELLLPDVWSVFMDSCYVGMMLWNVYGIVLWHVVLYLGVCILVLYVNLSLRIICGNFLGLHFFQWLISVCRCCWLGTWPVHRPPNQYLQQVQSTTEIYITHYIWEKNQKKQVQLNNIYTEDPTTPKTEHQKIYNPRKFSVSSQWQINI